jgi:hypothetical protein
MKLFMSGKTFEVDKEPAVVGRAKTFLDGSKDGELFNSRQLAGAIKRSLCNLRDNAPTYLQGYSHKVGGIRYFGKPATIKALIEETKKCQQTFTK